MVSFSSTLSLVAFACGSPLASKPPEAEPQAAEAIERRLIDSLEASQAQIHDLAKSLDQGRTASQTAQLVTLAHDLLSADVAEQCLQITRAKDVVNGYCTEKAACRKHYGEEVTAQVLDVFAVLVQHPDDDATAFAREIALDPRRSPRFRSAAIEVLEAAAPELSPEVAAARKAAVEVQQFEVLNTSAFVQLSRRLQACQGNREREISLTIRLPAGQSHAVVDGSGSQEDAQELCIRRTVETHGFERASLRTDAFFRLNVSSCPWPN